MNRKFLFVAILPGLLILVVFAYIIDTNVSKNLILPLMMVGVAPADTEKSEDDSMQQEVHLRKNYYKQDGVKVGPITDQKSTEINKCITFDDHIEQMIADANQMFVTMPAKAAGSSLKRFASACNKSVNQNQFDNFINGPRLERKYLTSSYELPKVVASHVYNDEGISDLMRDMTDKSLLIHIHRHETDRLLSSIIHVVRARLCGGLTHGLDTSIATITNGICVIEEEGLVDKIIAPKKMEIAFGQSSILTCKMFESIQSNNPNIIIVNYKQADRVQAAIAKKYCPDILSRQDNVRSQRKAKSFVKLASTGSLVDIEDWVQEKRDYLEWTLKLKAGISCQAETKRMEKDLFSCADESVIPMFDRFL